MPCTYFETDEEIATRENTAKRKLTQPYVDKLNTLTRILCWLSNEAPSKTIEFAADCPEKRLFLKWKEQHDKDDLKREALKKLTPAERKALGH